MCKRHERHLVTELRSQYASNEQPLKPPLWQQGLYPTSNNHTHFTQWLTRCVEVWKYAHSLFSFFTQLLNSLFIWTTECNTMNASEDNRLWESVRPFVIHCVETTKTHKRHTTGNILRKQPGGGCDSGLFTPPSRVDTGRNNLAFRRGWSTGCTT